MCLKSKQDKLEEDEDFKQIFHLINSKLEKLYDHILFLKDTSELFKNNSWQIILRKEMHYYCYLLQYIIDAKSKNTLKFRC